MKVIYYLFLFSLLGISCSTNNASNTSNPIQLASAITEPTDPDLAFLNIPEGFSLTYYAKDVDNARSMVLAEDGTLFVGSRRDKVHAVQDKDGDGFAEEVTVIVKDLKMPNGVALKDGDLYVAEIHRVIIFRDIASQLEIGSFEFEVFYDQYPTERHHGWKYIAFGPDEKLYVPVGAPCNICESEDDVFNSITRLDANANMEIVQTGVRNTVGFNWHPNNDKLWFTDNGGDNLGDNMPGDELNFASSDKQHFGFPYCHQGDFLDPEFGQDKNCDDYTPPAQVLGPHVAALGLEFWNTTNFPSNFKDHAFIAEHGSWNRSTPIGYRLTTVKVDENGSTQDYNVLLDGFRDNDKNEVYGRPVDLEWMADGSLLISDDYADCIYRLTYKP